jgi:hypothetical protein
VEHRSCLQNGPLLHTYMHGTTINQKSHETKRQCRVQTWSLELAA